MRQPALFVSHGAPSFILEECPANMFLKRLGQRLAKPDAIVVISAHHISRDTVVASGIAPRTIHDFGGFADELYKLTYPAPGNPILATLIARQLRAEGFDAVERPDRGYDHGAWIPLMLMFPDADIPVVQVSIDMTKGPLWHYRLGQALAYLRNENVMIIGSGSMTHSLSDFFGADHELNEPAPQWVCAFANWMEERLTRGDIATVLEAVETGPFGKRNHPTLDHLLPLIVAAGAGAGEAVRALHRSTTFGVLAMDVYGFAKEEELLGLRDMHRHMLSA
jgi:4,5-DOPA dioxygenase extradiol